MISRKYDSQLISEQEELFMRIEDIEKRIKALEQKDSYYPTKEKINNIKEVRNLNG